MPLLFAVSMKLYHAALASAPAGLPESIQFLRLCGAQHKRNYAESNIMLSPAVYGLKVVSQLLVSA